MNLKALKIGNLIAKIPIIQGGMGIGVSLAKLASAVAREGAIGVISGVQIGFREPDFESNTKEANIRALRKEIRKAKELSAGGILGINFLVAMNDYDEMVKVAVEEGIDLIISGAGLPLHLPSLVKGSNTKAVPIVSSAKAANVITKMWDRKFNYIPDAIIVEGIDAGGHLGFSFEELDNRDKFDFDKTIKEIIEVLKPYEEKYNKDIPVIVAGGVFDKEDIEHYMELGASGVQMATRFVATVECDADIKFKEAYINAKEEDICIIKSPVGMPGRAIKNKFIENTLNRKPSIKKCYKCLHTCDVTTTPYCISKALIEAANGNIDEGLIFTGSNSYKLKEIVTVKELLQNLIS